MPGRYYVAVSNEVKSEYYFKPENKLLRDGLGLDTYINLTLKHENQSKMNICVLLDKFAVTFEKMYMSLLCIFQIIFFTLEIGSIWLKLLPLGMILFALCFSYIGFIIFVNMAVKRIRSLLDG